jgi:hypothetical protein
VPFHFRLSVLTNLGVKTRIRHDSGSGLSRARLSSQHAKGLSEKSLLLCHLLSSHDENKGKLVR